MPTLLRYRYPLALIVLAIIVAVVIGAIKDQPFTPQGSYVTTVGGSPDSHKFDLAAGQQLGARFILSHSKDEDLSVCVCTLVKQGDGLWRKVSTLKDYGRVGDCQVVWFEAPSTGPYSLEVASHSGERLHVTVEYVIQR
jgi:hypothetical protein